MRIVSVLALSMAALLIATTGGFTTGWPEILIYQKDGSNEDDRFGWSVAGAGDVNGDGIDDFIIGAPDADPGGVSNAGSAYVYDGATGGLLHQKDGSAADDVFGNSVAGVGDVNGDGKDDFIIGAPYADPGGISNAGSAFVYDGATGGLLYQKDGSDSSDHFGATVAGVGDVNDDVTDDFIIGAPDADPGGMLYAGSAYVYDGATGSLLYQKDGSAAFDRFGCSLGGAGDVNGDGKDDFIVGAWLADPGGVSGGGSAYVYDGATGGLLYQKDGTAAGDDFGYSVAGAGDVNGDGIDDFIIGAPGSDPGGSAYIYDGATGGLLYQEDGTAARDYFGCSVAGAGDVNGDWIDDIIIGAYQADPGGVSDAGSAYVYDGATGGLLYQKDGSAADDRVGRSVAGAGDVNGDGKDDFIIGAWGTDPGGMSDAGSAFVMGVGRCVIIRSIADVPNDQGKQLRMRWLNLPGIGDSLMDLFIVYRRIDDGLSASTGQLAYDPGDLPPGDWEQVTVAAATGDTFYTTVVPTLVDSTETEGTQYSVFFVRGRSTNPLLYIDSPIDSGYSVDNLAPAPPPNLTASFASPDVALDWGAVTDADFDYYWVYRGIVPGFVLDPSNRIGATSDTSFLDTTAPPQTPFYKVCAVDFCGNEGNPSNEASPQACSCPFQCDYDEDTFLTAVDLSALIDVLFAGRPEEQDPSCPTSRGDFNNDGQPDALDLSGLIDHLFAGQPGPCDPCDPVQSTCVP